MRRCGRLAAIALLLGAASLPSGALAQSRRVSPVDDGLADPRAYDIEEDRDGNHVEAVPIFAPQGHRTLSLSDGGKGEIYLSDSDSGDLRLQADSPEDLPPVSVGDGSLHFEVKPPKAASGTPQPGERFPKRPRARLTKIDVFQERPPALSQGGAKPSSQARNDLILSFTGTDFTAPVTRYRYRLTGLDPEWLETNQSSVRYSDLQPATYRFEVLAMDRAGRWSEPTGLSIIFQAPPWWRQADVWIGVAIIGLALSGSLYAIVRARRLLHVERLRASIAADLHDQVGAGLTDIAILSEVAVRKAGDLPELERVAATARELVDGMGDIVWLVNPRHDSLYELFLRLKDSYAELFAYAGAQLEVGDLSPFEGARLPMPYRQDLHLLFKEALHNALRHSGCRRAELSVSVHRRHLEVELRDDGHGFDPRRRNGHGEGLETMRHRAERLGGLLIIDSSPQGTAVRFAGSLP